MSLLSLSPAKPSLYLPHQSSPASVAVWSSTPAVSLLKACFFFLIVETWTNPRAVSQFVFQAVWLCRTFGFPYSVFSEITPVIPTWSESTFEHLARDVHFSTTFKTTAAIRIGKTGSLGKSPAIYATQMKHITAGGILSKNKLKISQSLYLHVFILIWNFKNPYLILFTYGFCLYIYTSMCVYIYIFYTEAIFINNFIWTEL